MLMSHHTRGSNTELTEIMHIHHTVIYSIDLRFDHQYMLSHDAFVWNMKPFLFSWRVEYRKSCFDNYISSGIL